jgi:hypothetical protein
MLRHPLMGQTILSRADTEDQEQRYVQGLPRVMNVTDEASRASEGVVAKADAACRL